MKNLILVLMMTALVFAGPGDKAPRRTQQKADTIYVDGTETKYSEIYWQDEYGGVQLWVEGSDDSTAGFASDSACVSMELYQVANLNNHDDRFVALAKSKTADSTISDSLDVRYLDTLAAWARVLTPEVSFGDTVDYYGSDVLDSAGAPGFGAFFYADVLQGSSCDTRKGSPGLAVKITGKANNSTAGNGSKWILRWIGHTRKEF